MVPILSARGLFNRIALLQNGYLWNRMETRL